jgi:hypothetical protein
MSRKKGTADFDMSEPAFLISVMDRHDDWCVVICLIGGGQEINAGEAGLTEWFQALQTKFSTWKVFTSPQLAHRDYHWGQDLKAMLGKVDVTVYKHLHLAVSVRSFRAEKLSDFVGAVVAGEVEAARDLYNHIKATKLDRLSRDVAFVAGLMAQRVPFIVAELGRLEAGARRNPHLAVREETAWCVLQESGYQVARSIRTTEVQLRAAKMNKFQVSLTAFLLEVLSNKDLGDILVTVSKASDEVLVEVRLESFKIGFWVYDDGASIFAPRVDERFELAAFDSLEKLRRAYVERIEAFVNGLK